MACWCFIFFFGRLNFKGFGIIQIYGNLRGLKNDLLSFGKSPQLRVVSLIIIKSKLYCH